MEYNKDLRYKKEIVSTINELPTQNIFSGIISEKCIPELVPLIQKQNKCTGDLLGPRNQVKFLNYGMLKLLRY